MVNAKLPKIEISRFDGSLLDWPRFWGQFNATVDKRSVAPVNKFAYLCGFLSAKVKTIFEVSTPMVIIAPKLYFKIGMALRLTSN